jgi:hypothetical protein
MRRCAFCSGNLTDVLMHPRGAVDLEEPLIAHPQCCYFDGAKGTIGCQSYEDIRVRIRTTSRQAGSCSLQFSL